ncbi:MAG: tripartite tricarboxylate transporter TctB family protein [Bacillota bacterium]
MFAAVVGSLALTALAVAAVLGARHLPAWELTTPGAGLYPVVLSVALLVSSVSTAAGLVVSSAARGAGRTPRSRNGGSAPGNGEPEGDPPGRHAWRAAVFAAVCLAWALSLNRLGFGISSAIAGAAIAWLLESRRRLMAVGVGAMGALLASVLFSSVLGMQLP